MLSIGKLGSGQEGYYLGKVAQGAEDSYSGEGEAEGYWVGQLARELGLEGTVEPDQLIAILTGKHPVTGEPLGLKSAPGREPVPGFDLTFSAPKSVSLTWALGGHPVSGEVAEAHRIAVREALSYLERHACWARRGRGGAEFLQGKGFLAAAYTHRSSRAGDPQLHTHVLIANATLGPDGRWSRLYHPAIYEHAKTASYIYEAHLRWELTMRLGIEWGPVRNGITDIKGFSAEQLRHFSTRRAEILAAAGEGASARSMQVATLATRRAKERDLTDESLRELWRVKGNEVGLDRESIALRLGHELPGKTILTVEQIERAVTAKVSHFDRREAIQAVADNLPHGAPARKVEDVADAFLASDAVMRIAEGPRGPRFTTKRIWELERRALATAKELSEASDRCLVHPIHVQRVLAARPSLKPDQRAMVERLLTGGRGLEIVIGEAGSGKTYATVAAARGWQAQEIELIAAAPTWRAANVLRAEGVQAVSVARLLGQLDDASDEGGGGAMSPRTVLMVDEAGMVDSRTLARLIEHAAAAEAKLVLIGDPAQLGEIEAGGLFSALADRAEPIRLDQVIRHEHELDREASKLIREGRGGEAFDRYLAEERVHIAPDAVERREAMVQEWSVSKELGEDALMIAKSNAERMRLNEQARELLQEQGKLGKEEIGVGEARFAVGDEVITRVNDTRAQLYNRERWRVEEVDLESGRMRLAGIDTNRQVGVDPGYLGRVNPTDGAPALEHAYAVTIYQAQGATVDKAFVLADPSMDRQEFYVAASRSRQETYFYATPETRMERAEIAPHHPPAGIEHIGAAAGRDGSQSAAHDAALRDRLAALSTQELYAHRWALSSEVGHELNQARRLHWLDGQIAEATERLREIAEARAQLGPEPVGWRKRALREGWRREVASLDERERWDRQTIRGIEAKRAELPEIEHVARAEQALTDHLINERIEARLAAVRRQAPGYLVKELGERPNVPEERAAWDRGAWMVESFRAQHGVSDKEHAFGPELSSGLGTLRGLDHSREVARQETRRRLRDQQRQLQQVRQMTLERELRHRSLSIEM